MPILFKTLLADASIDPFDVKVLRHTLKKLDLFAVWRNDPADFEAYQAVQKRTARGHFNRPLWASFIALPEDRAIFVGMYRARRIGGCPLDYDERVTPNPAHPSLLDLYDCQRTPDLAEYAGRLEISFLGRNWRQNGEGGHAVAQLSDHIRDPRFPGLLEFIRPLSEVIRLPESWRPHLEQGRGIYLLTCPRTQEQYVGKADGADGFLGRWRSYVANGHGCNIKLKSRDPSDYRVSILEVAGSSDGPLEIGRMEERWKLKLQSREMGLNAN